LGYALRNAAARMSRAILDNVSMFIVLSEFQRARFIAGGIEPDRVAVLPNFDPDLEDSAGLANGAGETVSFVGRLSPEKGIGDFLAAARSLPDLPFAVAGDTTHAAEFVRSAPPNVAFHGFLSGNALNAFYRSTRVFVFPSVWFEGFPNAVARAMSFAKPVVAADIGAIPEIVEHDRTGLLYPPGDVPRLTERICGLYGAPALCQELGAAGRAKALRAYHPDRIYAALMEIYDRAGKAPLPA